MLELKTTKKKIDQSTTNALSGNATRVSYLADSEMKKLKIKSIMAGIDIKDLLNAALIEIMKNEKNHFSGFKANTKKRSFIIHQTTLQQMKIFLVGQNGITQDGLIYNAILKII
jgi:hypothetical protein